tara:strand:- start:713 stop:1069 length:357 start_codon:yes stop_codon:yes gene_type:complete
MNVNEKMIYFLSKSGIVWANIFYRHQHAVRIELFATEELSITARKIWEKQIEISHDEVVKDFDGAPKFTVNGDHYDPYMQDEIQGNEYHSLVTTKITMNLDEYSEFGLNMNETIEKYS